MLQASARGSIRPADMMQVVEEFPENALGVLSSDNGTLGAPRWRFMRLSDQAQWLTDNGLARVTRAQWHEHLAQEDVSSALDYIWESVYVGELPGIPMAAAEDVDGRIIVRDIFRTITPQAAIRCVLRLAPLNLVLTLAMRPPRELRQAEAVGRLRAGGHQAAFHCVSLTSGLIAARHVWHHIIHLIVAPKDGIFHSSAG